MIPSCRWMCNICILVYSCARLYGTSQALPVIALPRVPRTNLQVASLSLAHKYMPTFIRTEYQTMIFIIWLIIQLLQLQLVATGLVVLVALHDTLFYICTTETLEDASGNATATKSGCFHCMELTSGAAGRWMLRHMFSSERRFLHYAHEDPCGTPNEITQSVFLRACKKLENPLNVISCNFKLEKFSKTVQPFKFLLTWGDYEKEVLKKRVYTCLNRGSSNYCSVRLWTHIHFFHHTPL